MEKKYTLGIDFGSLSGRAVLADVRNGAELASAVMDYPHAVMDRVLAKTGAPLPPPTPQFRVMVFPAAQLPSQPGLLTR